MNAYNVLRDSILPVMQTTLGYGIHKAYIHKNPGINQQHEGEGSCYLNRHHFIILMLTAIPLLDENKLKCQPYSE
jgi:hypothetical protein